MLIKEIKNDDWLETREAFEIYAPCMYEPSFEKYIEEISTMRENSAVRIFACADGENFTGIIVYKTYDFITSEILGIAVKDKYRGNGIGTGLIHTTAEFLNASCVIAQTDENAVGFYRKAGFFASPFTKHFPDGDATRYRCILQIQNN